MKPLHVTHIIPTLRYGGAERFVVDLINATDPNTVRYSVIVFEENGPLEQQIDPEKRHVAVVKKKGRPRLHLIDDLAKTLKDLQPDIVHTHLFGGDFWGRISAKSLGIPVISTEHNINRDESWIRHFLKRELRTTSMRYTAPSRAVADFMRSTYKIEDVEIIPIGVQLNAFASVSALRMGEPLRLVILGRLVEQKGHMIALQALRHLTDLPWQLEIVGEGEKMRKIQRYIEKYDLVGRVRLSPSTGDVAGVFARNHIVLMPSLWEGFGIVAREAMAAGRLLLASRIDGLTEGITEDADALFVSAGDPIALAEKIRWIYQHQHAAQEIARQGREKAIQSFGFEKMMNSYVELYKNLLHP